MPVHLLHLTKVHRAHPGRHPPYFAADRELASLAHLVVAVRHPDHTAMEKVSPLEAGEAHRRIKGTRSLEIHGEGQARK